MKKKQQKVRYKLSNKITEKEMKERINKAFDILFVEILKRYREESNQKID